MFSRGFEVGMFSDFISATPPPATGPQSVSFSPRTVTHKEPNYKFSLGLFYLIDDVLGISLAIRAIHILLVFIWMA